MQPTVGCGTRLNCETLLPFVSTTLRCVRFEVFAEELDSFYP